MANILIRDVSDEALAAIDAKATRVGLSRRRYSERERPTRVALASIAANASSDTSLIRMFAMTHLRDI